MSAATEAVSRADAGVVRRRMMALAAGGFVTSAALTGIMVVLPLYVTNVLHLPNAQFARVMTVRNIGITAGVILLGLLSDRLGARRTSVACLVVAGVLYAAMGFVPYAGLLAVIAVLSATVSTVFVNLNHLTQSADPQRPGRANTVYRAAGAIAGVAAPLVMTQFVAEAAWVFVGTGAMLVLGAILMRLYAVAEPVGAFRGWRGEAGQMARTYPRALAQRRLMAFVNLSLVYICLALVVGTFIAIRLSNQLGMAEGTFGAVAATGSGLTLAAILILGLVLDRIGVKRVLLGHYAIGAACLVGMGLSGEAWSTAVLFVGHAVIMGSSVAPMSMWLAGEARTIGLTTGFAVQKVLNAAYAAGFTLVFAWCEPWMGIRGLFLWCGIASVPVVAAMALLRTPPPAVPAGRATEEAAVEDAA